MSFYTLSANSFAAVRTALFDACVANGWALSGEILTKGAAALRVELNTTSTGLKGAGLILRCGMGVSAGAIIGASPVCPRFGPLSNTVEQITWPMQVDIHIHGNEVYLIGRYNVDVHLYLAFGISSVPINTGVWASASTYESEGTTSVFIAMSPAGGGVVSTYNVAPAPFWCTSNNSATNARLNNNTACVNLDGIVWAGAPDVNNIGVMQAIAASAPLMARQPNAWNSEAILLRIQAYMSRASSKLSMVVDLMHARYVRVDNYEPGQIITLGSDKWKIYPAYKKNAAPANRDGGNNINHSGTFGWAVRYDGE